MSEIKNDVYEKGEYENPFLKGLEEFSTSKEWGYVRESIDDSSGTMLWCMLRLMAGLLAIVWELRATRRSMEDESSALGATLLAGWGVTRRSENLEGEVRYPPPEEMEDSIEKINEMLDDIVNLGGKDMHRVRVGDQRSSNRMNGWIDALEEVGGIKRKHVHTGSEYSPKVLREMINEASELVAGE